MTAPVREGDILAGKYRVERVLGVGGMGVVVAAWHLQLDERVAIKFLLPEAMENGEAVGRFAREARAAVKIKGEHVARVIDVGTLETGAPYMVMEYLEGGDLSGVLQERGRLPVADAVEFVLQASEAIAEAHALGIIHRDLKPANLFLTRRPDGSSTVKVLDFGISKTMTRAASSRPEQALTRTTAVMGSPLYMSPEQMASTRDVDGRTDIWALGAILYELLAGGPPFSADTMPQLCAMILQGSPAPLQSIRHDVPPALEAIIMRCLEKDRQRRPPHIADLAMALAPFAPPHAQVSVGRIIKMQQAAGITGSGLAPSGVGAGSALGAGSGAGAGSALAPAAQSGAALETGAAAAPAAVAPQTVANWAESKLDRAPSGRKLAFALGGAGVALSIAAVVFVLRPTARPAESLASHDQVAPAAARPVVLSEPHAGPAAEPATAGSIAPAATPAALAHEPPPAAAASAPVAGSAAPRARPAPGPAVASPARGTHRHPGTSSASAGSSSGAATPNPASTVAPASTSSLFDDRK